MEKYKLAIRFLKENHCLKRYYEDYQLANKKTIKINDFIEIMKRNEKYVVELSEYIGSYSIFSGWSINEKYRIFWLNFYYKMKDFYKLTKIIR